MSTAVIERKAVQNALPDCLCPWLENPYRLVSLRDMLQFDAGRLSTHVMLLCSGKSVGDAAVAASGADYPMPAEQEKYWLDGVRDIVSYCDDAGFPLTKIPLERVLRMRGEDGCLTADMIANLFGNAMERLRDEAGTVRLLRISTEKVKYYDNQEPFGPVVSSSFPSAVFDSIEACRCLAVNRSTACVFHLMRVLESGLRVLGARFGIPCDHTNWHNIIEGIEKSVRNMAADPARPTDWKDQQEFFSQAAAHFMVIKNAWRNYTAHARGKYTDEEAETLLFNVKGFMQTLATRLHE
jgi:hypothetical protein